MSLQFADIDADGDEDMITATFEGHAFVSKREGKGKSATWSQPEYLLDKNGRRVVLSYFYDNEKRNYDQVNHAWGDEDHGKAHMVSAQVFDWDADGDYDLLLGAKDGRLFLQRNEGDAKNASFSGINELLRAGNEPFNVPGGLTAARPVDWDGDGLVDLVCGSFEKGVWLYRNTGAKGAPRFDAGQQLIGDPGQIGADDLQVNSKYYATPVDWDEDGDLDLLVGGYANWMPPQKPLTDEQKQRLAELDKESREVASKISAMFREFNEANAGLSREELAQKRTQMYQRQDYKKLRERSAQLAAEIRELRPSQRRDTGIWVFPQGQRRNV